MNPSELNSSSLSQKKYKVVLLGDSGVGKSSIIDRFVKGEIDIHNQPTVGIDFLSRNLIHNGKTYKLQLWDTAGQEKYRSLVPAYLKDANCCLLVFEPSRKETFQNLTHWLSLVREHAPTSICIFVVANKCDLLQVEQCQYLDELKTFGEQEKLSLVETSAKTGANIEYMFDVMAGELEAGAQNQESMEDDRATYQFFLKYNRVDFDYGRKGKCCHI